MSRILLVACALFFLNLSFAQINVQWESRYNGTGNFIDKATDLVLDAAGNTYVTGSSYNGTSYDWVTVKYNNAGIPQWTATYGGAGLDQATAIALDGSNNVVVTGSRFVSGSDWDLAVVKYNGATGAQSWAYLHTGSTNFDGGKDITVDSNNDVVVTGTFSASSTNVNWIVLKLNGATGTTAWTPQTGGGTGNDEGKIVLTDAANTIYVGGHQEFSSGSTYFDFLVMKFNSATGAQISSTTRDAGFNGLDTPHAMKLDASGNIFLGGQGYNAPIEEEDYALMKFNNALTHQWTRTYAGDATVLDRINALAVDQATGNVYVTGQSKSNASSEDYYTIAYNTSGVQLWNKRYTSPGTGFDEATDIVLSGTGFIYITGYSFESGSNNDYTTLKYDLSGNLIWDTRFNGPSGLSDQAIRLALDPAENIYVTGSSHGGSTNLDYSTIKYCQLTTVASPDAAICLGQSIGLTASGGTNITWAVLSGDAGSLSCTSCTNPTATPNVNTVYTVSSMSGSGCIDYDTVYITVNPIPTPVIHNDTPLSFCAGDSVKLYTDSYAAYSWSPTVSVDSFITATSSGTYTVTITDANGCQNSAMATVNVFALPNVDAGTATTICPGNSTPLLASGASTYLWTVNPTLSQLNIPNPNATPTAQTMYYVVGTDGNGCKSKDSVQISLFTLPVVNAGLDDQVCVGDSTQLNATGAVSYIWNASPSLTSLVIPNPFAFPSSLTTYTVTGTDANGCTDQDQVSVSTISLPGVDAGATNSHCLGDSTQLFATGALTWVWSPNPTISNPNINNPYVDNTVNTMYYVTGTDVNGCSKMDSVLITIDALPNVSAGMDFGVCDGDQANLMATGASTYQWDFHPTFQTATNIANPSATPIVTTTFSVVGTSSAGCENTASVTVTVNPLPIINAGVDTSMCIGDSLQLNASGGSTYLWNANPSLSNNLIPNPWSHATTTTTYYLDAYDSNSCFGEDSVKVTVNPLPSAPVIFEINQWLISSYTTGNQWYFNGSPVVGETNDSLDWVAQGVNGSYTLLQTNSNGCKKFSEVTNIIVIDDIGYEELAAFEVKLYPNPTRGILNIEVGEGVDFVQVIALNGQIVFAESNLSAGLNTIDLSEFAEGTYVVQLVQGDKIVSKRIVIQ